jgi:hypothetical protein
VNCTGFWVGLLIGISLEAVIYMIIVWRTNWQHECNKAQERAGLSMEEKGAAAMHDGKNEDDGRKMGISHNEDMYGGGSEVSPLLGDSTSTPRRTPSRRSSYARYSQATLGSLRTTRMSLGARTTIPQSHYDPTKFWRIVAIRFVTYVLLCVLLGVGIMLHLCIPMNPGDQFCYRIESIRNESSMTSPAHVSMSTVQFTATATSLI